jgi:four helix bundle protein
MKTTTFEDLSIWQRSMNIATNIYDLSSESAFSRDFALRDQIRRAAISISSNIAEGFDRNNNKEYVRFLFYAKGSASEVCSQLYIAKQLGYDDMSRIDSLISELKSLARSIGYLISKIRNS